MPIEIDNESHCSEFMRLNEIWITEHFVIEEADRKIAADPFKVVRDGGHLLSLVIDGRVVGVCALIRESAERYELGKMAVDPSERGKGHGDTLIKAAIDLARMDGAKSIYLISNTILTPAISLYRKHGFQTTFEGQHPIYARGNIVMERAL